MSENCVYLFLVILLISIILIIIVFKNRKETFNSIFSSKPLRLCYVITIPERKKYIQSIMPKFNLNPIIFPATLKKNISKDKLIESGFLHPETKLNIGQIACHLSHIQVLKTFLNSSEPRCLIFEDDIEPARDSKDYYSIRIKKFLMMVPDDFDLIYLGRCYDRCKQDKIIGPGLVQCFFPLCRHSYIVSRKGAQKIIMNTIPLKIQGDNTIANLISQRKIKAYAAKPAIFFQNRKKLGSFLNNNDTLRECW